MPHSVRVSKAILFVVYFMFTATGCGGGGGGNDGSDGFFVGGTVLGLAGQGLVLLNNDSETLAIQSSGDFRFAQTIKTGSAYAITIATQPVSPMQVCSVGSGSGTVAGADIASVTVHCLSMKAVKVSVDGLAGGGLVLQNNGTDDLTVNGDGIFAFATELTAGGNFDISVLTQPADPIQVCTVTAGAGTVENDQGDPVVSVHCKMAHKLGGRVVGLTGGGLLLQNNVDTVEITASGEFTFAQAVGEDEHYSVSVARQPASPMQNPNQECAANAADGTMGITAVDNIVIDCIDNVPPAIWSSLPLAGERAGERRNPISVSFDEDILPTSLVLDLYSGATPAIELTDADGNAVTGTLAFDVPTHTLQLQPDLPLTMLGSYQVNVSREITDLVGNPLSGTSSYAFTVRDGRWSDATLLEHNDNGTVWNPSVAVDPQGRAIAVWRQHDGRRYNIWASHFTPANGWGEPELIELNDLGNAWDPKVAIDAQGNAIAVWSQHSGVRENIWANRYTPDTGWGKARLIELDSTGGVASTPTIAMNADGMAIAVWREYNGTRENIWANVYTPTDDWALAKMIEMEAGTAKNPQITVDAQGNGYAIWQQSDGTRDNIWVNQYSAATDWQGATTVEANDGAAANPRIAVDPSGVVTAVWQQVNGLVDTIYGARYTADNGWIDPVELANSKEGNSEYPSLAAAVDGSVFVVWNQYDSQRSNVWANRFVVGEGWQQASLLETENSGGAYSPAIGVDAQGRALVTWFQSDGERYNVWTNRYLPDTGWAEAKRIDSESVSNAFNPAIALSPAGEALLVWRQWDGVRDNIKTSRFD